MQKYEKMYNRASVESHSMEVDYKDILSIELDEGVSVNMMEMSPKKNDISGISPKSKSIVYQNAF